MQTGTLAGFRIHTEEHFSAITSVGQTITSFHRLWCSLQKKYSELLRCYGRAGACWRGLASVEILVPVLVPIAAPCRGKTLTQKRFSLEARVGIGHFPSRLHL